MTRFLGYLCFCTFIFSCAKDDVEPAPSFESHFEESAEVEDFSHMMTDFEEKTLELINEFRAEGNSCGNDLMDPAEPLMWHPNLDDAAEAHADDMFDNDILSHEGSNGSDLDERLKEADYIASHWGENVAKGPRTPAECVEAFKNSPGHCKVMSSPNFKQVGIAKIGEYWVFDFGTEL